MGENFNFSILRHNSICIELKINNGDQILVYKLLSYYSTDKYIYAIKDNTDLTKRELFNIFDKAFSSVKVECVDRFFNSRYLTNTTRQNTKYVEDILNDLESSINPKYVSLSCINLIYELSKMNAKSLETYGNKIIPYLTKTENFLGYNFRYLISNFESTNQLSKEIKADFYLNLYRAIPDSFDDDRSLFSKIKESLKYALSMKRKDLKDILNKTKIISADDINAKFVLDEYKGIGIKPEELLDCLLLYKKTDLLYFYLTENIKYVVKNFDNNNFSIALYLRFLASNGYTDKIPLLAKKLIPYVKNVKDYYSLRVFLSDNDILDIFIYENKNKNKDYNYYLALRCEEKNISDQIKAANKFDDFYYGYYTYRYVLLSYTYSYLNNLEELSDYTCKDFRTEIRNEMNCGKLESYYEEAIGLVCYQDKNATRYFFSPEFDRLLGNPYFALTKALAYTKQGKKIKNMYQYPEVK